MTPPVDIDADTARDAAAAELADPAYRAAEPSVVERALQWLGDLLAGALSSAGTLPGGLAWLVVIAAVVFLVVRSRTGPVTRSRRAGRPVYGTGPGRSAADHRLAAEQALARGELHDAVRERFRALARELERRGVLDERSARTVDEIAAQAGQALPGHAGRLRAAATLFDDVVYGGRLPGEAGYRDLAALDDDIQALALR